MTQAGKTPLSTPLDTPQYPVSGRFAAVVADVLGIEGGFGGHPADHGGATKYGISLRFLKAEGRLDLDHDGKLDLDLDFDGDLDGADIRLLTPVQAKNLYFLCFWKELDLNSVPLHIDAALFDQAVNGGISAAVKLLQRALNRLALAPGALKVDGVLGRHTRARVGVAIRTSNIDSVLIAYRQEAAKRYRAIVDADHSQVVFLKGWLRRAERLGHV